MLLICLCVCACVYVCVLSNASLVWCWQCMCTRRSGKVLFASSMTLPFFTPAGTNDKTGSPFYLLRWMSPLSIKESLAPLEDWSYPSVDPSTLLRVNPSHLKAAPPPNNTISVTLFHCRTDIRHIVVHAPTHPHMCWLFAASQHTHSVVVTCSVA